MHYRKRIREAVRALLTAADTLAGPNVFTSRARPVLEILQRREVVLSVYTADEESQRSEDGHLLVRTLEISVEGIAGGGEELDDVLDDLAGQVEAAVDADPTLGALLHDDMELTSTTTEITARGNMQIGAFRMTFACQYVTERIAQQPGPPLPTRVYVNPMPDYGDDLPAGGCADGVCNPPFYGGDTTDESLVQP